MPRCCRATQVDLKRSGLRHRRVSMDRLHRDFEFGSKSPSCKDGRRMASNEGTTEGKVSKCHICSLCKHLFTSVATVRPGSRTARRALSMNDRVSYVQTIQPYLQFTTGSLPCPKIPFRDVHTSPRYPAILHIAWVRGDLQLPELQSFLYTK